jgi:tRNA-modifying protein YgfZ
MNETAFTAFRESAAFFDLPGRGKIRVTGQDRARLLHAMCTNHVQDLQPGTGCYAFFLTAQGRILADAYVYCMPDYLLLDTEPETKQRLMEHLDKYIIADDAELRDFTEATATVGLEGPRAGEILTELGALPGHLPCSLVEWGHRQVARCSYTGGDGYSIFVPPEEKAELLEQLRSAGAVEADTETLEAARILSGKPRFGLEIADTNIPQETGQMHAVHFSKGCYLGQEIVERVRSRGHVNRQLKSVRIDGERPERGAKILSGDKEVGEILSSATLPDSQVAALAMLRSEALIPGSSLKVGTAPVTVVA